MSRSVVMSVTS